MKKSGETVNLAILDRTKYDAVIVDQMQGNALMRMSASIGGKLPMHASGADKAVLAALPKSQRLPLLEKQMLHAYTPYTLTSPSALEENFSDIWTKEFSYGNQEHALAYVVLMSVFMMNSKKFLPQFPSQARVLGLQIIT